MSVFTLDLDSLASYDMDYIQCSDYRITIYMVSHHLVVHAAFACALLPVPGPPSQLGEIC